MLVYFSNPGEIDLDAVTTMGVSVKEGDNPIGYFGTGMKYAIAILLRNKCSITLMRGIESYKFGVISKSIRGQAYDIVTMTDDSGDTRQLGFSTELGKNWQLWQAYRELYCNCMDERGAVSARTTFPKPEAGKTKILVTGADFEAIHYKKKSFILETKPLWANNDIEIHRGISDTLYYRGVRAKVLPYKTQYTYNIISTETLTEDRTLESDYYASSKIASAIIESQNTKMIENCIADEDTFEARINWKSAYQINDTFKECVKNIRGSRGVCRSAVAHYNEYNEDISEAHKLINLNSVQEQQFERAMKLLKKLGLVDNIDKFPIVFTDSLPHTDFGLASHGTIIINDKCFNMGTKMLAGTIYEEYLHLEKNFYDCSRDFQNFLMDKVMSVGEQALGEPF